MADNTHCSIVGLLGILIQVILGVLSFSVLIIKRHFEEPKRPWRVWCFDTMKQGISQLLAHFLNLLISLILTVEDPNSDTCLWYFITNIFDNTFGVFLSVMILRKIQKRLLKRKKYQLISGYYYEIKEEKDEIKHEIDVQPGELQQQIELSTQKVIINYRAWFIQLGLWNSVFIISKILVFVSEFFLRDVLDGASHFLLGWIEKYPDFELVLVIVVVPVMMNGLAFWIVDNFLKKRDISREVDEIQREKQIQMQEKESNEQMNSRDKKQQITVAPQNH